MKNNPDIFKSEDKTRKLLAGLNLAGGVKMLPFLSVHEIKLLLERVKENQFMLCSWATKNNCQGMFESGQLLSLLNFYIGQNLDG
ncbi:MAG: hypothetical protein IPI88_15720 [Chitinophagaceae bacterium]|nr:hypothetical protein [Chitinophagaceae bacterium]